MKFNISKLLVICLFFVAFTLGIRDVRADPYNSALNPSFEDGNNNPTGWLSVNSLSCSSQTSDNSLNLTWTNEKQRTGSQSVAIKNVDWSSSEPSIKPGWITANFVDVNPRDERYQITIHATGDNANVNLSANLVICLYDSNSNYIRTINTPLYSTVLNPTWERWGNNISVNDGQISKIKIGVVPACTWGYRSCKGDLWFDDVAMRPRGNDLTIYKFEDSNLNEQKNIGEKSAGARFQLFNHFDCVFKADRYPYKFSIDEEDGYTTFLGTMAGEYSVLEFLENGWSNTTPLCQNITVQPKTTIQEAALFFGNVKGPTVPYFSQKNPAWGNHEYDSASTYGPFFCGTTIKGCGCATTSAAMLLNFHGANKDPSGNETSPSTLNTWLKNNNGYAKFGALKWNSVAAYSIKANATQGTQKIKFSGLAGANDFATLSSDLTNSKPAILEEPGHFILATTKNGFVYNINDPFYENRKTLDSYSNSFSKIVRYEKTNTDLSAIYIQSPAPTDIFLTNSTGQRVGKDPTTGIIYTEIPNSYYYVEEEITDPGPETQTVSNGGVTTLIVLLPPEDLYRVITSDNTTKKIEFSSYDQEGNITTKYFENGANEFNITFNPMVGSQTRVEREVEIDYIPGSSNNNIIIKKTNFPLAILGSSTFNVKDIDQSSIIIATSGKPKKGSIIIKDYNRDRINDLFFLFDPKASGVKTTDTKICIAGKTKDGNYFKGCDSIKVIPR